MFKMHSLPELPTTAGLVSVERHDLQSAFDGYVTALCEHFCLWANTGNGPAPAGADPRAVTFSASEAERMAADLVSFVGKSTDAQLWVQLMVCERVAFSPEAWFALGRDFATTRNGLPLGDNFLQGPRVEYPGGIAARFVVGARLASWAYAQGEQHLRATLRSDGACVGEVIAP